MKLEKTVTRRAHVPRRTVATGLSIAQLHGEQLPEHLDPFLGFDHFEMAEPFFPPHPHAGFSAVTYMFPQSKSGFVNRDSRGDRIDIRPGDLLWTCAGSGIVHEEIPAERGVVCHGLQIFVNLHSSKKWMTPEVLHLAAASVPRVVHGGCEVRVVVGRHGDVESPLVAPTEVTLLDVVLDAGASFEHTPRAGESRFVYVIDGEVSVGPEERPLRLEKGEAAGFSEEGAHVRLRSSVGAHVVVAGGVPLREPVVFLGPFCMNTREDVMRAAANHQAGLMGHLERSF